MSTVLNYINSNSLPLVTWLNADEENILATSNSFTWKNKKPDISYDFILASTAVPSRSISGVTFSPGQYLRSRAPFSITSNDYTVLWVYKNTQNITNLLISYLKPNSVDFEVNYILDSNVVIQEYSPSLLKSESNVSVVPVDSEVVRTALVHKPRKAKNVSVSPVSSASNILSKDTFHQSPTGFIQIGGSGYIENLYHLLVFDSELTVTQIQELLNLLLYSTPVLNENVYWDLIIDSLWDSINESMWDNIL